MGSDSGHSAFDGYTAAELRESANYVSKAQDESNPPRRFHRRCFDPSGMLVMAWVEHTLDALDLLHEARDMFIRGDFDSNDDQRERLRAWMEATDGV